MGRREAAFFVQRGSNQNGRLETVNRRLAGQPEEYSCAQVSAQNWGANLGHPAVIVDDTAA